MIELDDPGERRIGPYTIVSSLAHGATSEVVKAIDTDLRRTVAIKLLSPEFVKDSEALARFERESRAITQLDHPNIARIYETGISVDGQPYLVMEFVDGRSLMELIQDKIELPISQQLELIIQVAEGLRGALNRNIIHRDIKPANLMVNRDYLVKIVDFGLHKVIREDTYQSVAGRLMGTPRYMAPEVAMGRPADHRSDIYSLGATSYHFLAGQPPFDGETPAAVMMRHVNSPLTPLYLLSPQIPADVCEIVNRAMAKDPNHRYQDYDELLSDLKAAKMARWAKDRAVAGAPSLEEQAAEREAAQVAAVEGEEPAVVASGASETPAEAAGTRRRPPSYMTQGRVIAAERVEPTAAAGGGGRLVILAIVLLAGVAGLLFLARPGEMGESSGGLRGLVQTLMARLSSGETAEDRYYRQYEATLERVAFIASAVKEYVSATGRDPATLDDLIQYKLVTEDDVLDGFGESMRYEPTAERVRAPGPDGRFDTGDDFLADKDGRLLMYPPKPDRLEVKEFLSVRERGKQREPSGL